MVESLIKSLALTLIIELAAAILLGIRSKSDIRTVICCNICTNPVIVYILNIVLLLGNKTLYTPLAAVLELIAVLTEYLLYKKFLVNKNISPFVLSLVCNTASLGAGIIINYICKECCI